MLSAGLARRGADLLHHQCWAWGADVRRSEGNLLLRYGFERAALGAARRYVLKRGGRLIVLWPFGLAFSRPERMHALAIFVERFEFEPRCITPQSAAAAWSSAQFDVMEPDDRAERAALAATLGAVRWIEAYERWVQGVAGKAYRDRTLLAWDRAVLGATELQRGWRSLALELEHSVSRTTAGWCPEPSVSLPVLRG